MLGLGLSVPQIAEFSSAPAFSPLSLFAASEPGVWFDPSDLSTMFQDNAGTTPVTATGQTVGLILDKSRGLAVGGEVVANGGFESSSSWSTPISGASITGGELVFDGVTSMTAGATITSNTPSISIVSGRTYLVTYTIVSGTTALISVGLGAQQGTARSAAGTYSEYITATDTTSPRVFTRSTTAARTGSIDNISVKEVSGRHASQATSGSRPTYQVDGNGKAYLSFDGSDDSLATAAIDLSGANRLTLCAGVRKQSDASVNTIVEFTNSFGGNNGSFNLSGPYLAGVNNFSFISKGSAAAINTVSGYTAPVTAVITGLAHIAGPSNVIRVNGTQVGSITTSQGTGNYSNSILYIGRRAGTSNPFNGRLYQLVIRAATTAGTDLSNLETWVNGKTDAY